jgi:PadR family transcriptional regulator AphA
MPKGSLNFRYLILGMLTEQPMSGYDIRGALEGLSWPSGAPSFSNIYSTLHALLNDGLVTVKVVPQQDKPTRKVYSVTKAGEQMLQEWATRSITPGASLKSFTTCLILADVFSQDTLIAHLQQRRDQVIARCTTLEEKTKTLDQEKATRQRLAAEYGLTLANAELTWLDRTLDRIHQLSRRSIKFPA